MTNSHVVEEYDFASNSLISEILSMAESNSNFIRKSGVQTLIDYVMTADQRVSYYRSDYDFIAEKFNFFVNKNKRLMKEIDRDSTYEKRPLFQMASDN
ncbi:MAG: hypothetical protein JJE09_01115 [Bacteroidia bacterium]|nr:hypothetical protein [Bacteroidia bacterium]